MTESEINEVFTKSGALLTGHFELRSKLHSDRYFQCANLLRYPRVAARCCDAVVEKLKASDVDLSGLTAVISPAVGGILVGHEVARALDAMCVFAEKVTVPGEVDATGKPVTKLAMRRFALQPGGKYLVAEDVVTRGGRVQETIDLVRAAGAEVVAAVVLVDRSEGKAHFDCPWFSLVKMSATTWQPSECPLCRDGGSPTHPGS